MPGEFHGQRSLAGYSPWGLKELDMIEQLTHTPSMWVVKSSRMITALGTERRTRKYNPQGLRGHSGRLEDDHPKRNTGGVSKAGLKVMRRYQPP